MKNKISVLFIFSLICSFYFSQNDNILPATGKVGIGTLAPSEKLEVRGKMNVDSLLWLKGGLKATNIDEVVIEAPNPNQSANQYKFLVVDDNGIIKRINGNATDVFFPEKGCKYVEQGIIPNPVWNSGVNKLFVDCPEVNVGINTDAPRVKLDVLGGVQAYRLSLGHLADPTSMGSKMFYMRSLNTVSQGDKIFKIDALNSNEIFSIKQNGELNTKGIISEGNFSLSGGSFTLNSNLGENQNSKIFIIQNNGRKILQLNNNGLLQARQLKVNLETSSWADYVFVPGYKLKKLPEVEAFINKNGHLPNVPNAKTVQQEGIDVAEMDRTLLEKIEELYLYVIEQDKRIKELENIIEKK